MTPLLSVWPDTALSDLSAPLFVLLLITAFAVSYLSGMVGLALGIIRLPLLLAFGIPVPVAAGTNLAVSVLTAVTSGWHHYRAGRVAFRVVFMIGVPAFAGAFIGGLVSDDLRAWVLLALVALILFWSGLVAVARGVRPRRVPAGGADSRAAAPPATPRRLAVESGVGFGVGVLGGAVGLVLGTVRMPALVNVLKLPPAIAIGTNTIIGLLVGASGFASHVLAGNLDAALIVALGGTGMVGSYLGARATGRMDADTLRLAVGIVLLVISPIMAYRSFLEFPG